MIFVSEGNSIGGWKQRMEAKDGSAGFDFEGTYTIVEENRRIAYVMEGVDARTVSIKFVLEEGGCKVVETFETEEENPLEMQRFGWQAILDNFKKYVEKN